MLAISCDSERSQNSSIQHRENVDMVMRPSYRGVHLIEIFQNFHLNAHPMPEIHFYTNYKLIECIGNFRNDYETIFSQRIWKL